MNQRATMPLADRLWSKVRRGDAHECWAWRGSLNNNGYGQIRMARRGRLLLAHRVAFELLRGPIPSGLSLDHVCRNPACVNPAHLEAVSHAENIRRGKSAIGHRVCKRGHVLNEDNLYFSVRGARSCRTCAKARAVAQRSKSRLDLARQSCGLVVPEPKP